MKTVLLSIFCFVGVTQLNAQTVWCPPGAQWHYDYLWFALNGYVQLTYVGDTVLDGVACKQLFESGEVINQATGQISSAGAGARYTYETNGVVFGYGWNGWDTLFNLNAAPGDRWGVFQGDDSSYVVVLDTGHNQIQGYNLKWMTVEYDIPFFPTGWPIDTIYERIGFTGYNYPFESSVLSTDPYIHSFCNYSDSAFNDWSNADTACKLLPSGLESIESKPIDIYPNPVNEFMYLKISSFHQPVYIALYSTDGKKLLEQTVVANHPIDLRKLPPGFYTVSIQSHQGVFHQKIIKTSP